MPRIVSPAERMYAIHLMLMKDKDGKPLFGQREMEQETGLSRPYIRKLAREVGHQFPRNGIEVRGVTCMCANCGFLFRKPPSRITRAKNQFCDDLCRKAWMKGSHHPMWKTGVTAKTFSSWVKNQSQYDKWRKAVLERDNHMCTVSGRTDHLDVHHILMKAEAFNPEKAFDVDNGITLNAEVHDKLHVLIREGRDFDEAVKILRKEYE